MICNSCGQLTGIDEYDEKLWDLHGRRRDRRQYGEALVFDAEWLQENVRDEEDYEILDITMSKDMHQRGLCPTCGRPNLSGMTDADFMDEDEAREAAEAEAERRAEMRMGC